MSVLPDVLASNLDIVFCGTAPGRESARRGAYYAGPGNAFWPTLYKVGLTPRLFAPEEFARVTDHGIGLTDVAKQAFGSDADLADADFSPADLRDKLRKYQPRILAFTSKRAAQEFLGQPAVDYGQLAGRCEGVTLFVLTSPSGRARGYWQQGKHWQELAELVHRLKAL